MSEAHLVSVLKTSPYGCASTLVVAVFSILVLLLDTILNLLSLFKITRSDFLTWFLRSKFLNSKFQKSNSKNQIPTVMLNLIQHRILLLLDSKFQLRNQFELQFMFFSFALPKSNKSLGLFS
jgi:hypothetical protein